MNGSEDINIAEDNRFDENKENLKKSRKRKAEEDESDPVQSTKNQGWEKFEEKVVSLEGQEIENEVEISPGKSPERTSTPIEKNTDPSATPELGCPQKFLYSIDLSKGRTGKCRIRPFSSPPLGRKVL